ncbi:DUF5946 family protein [Streptomyces carpaticus]|uniref:DUF5946 family protein n=1 Tax=Streptomyces carpaticus TaxID=285558 RepID=UPI00220154E8|nr:DUF5946 family protein [Streptomyces carpaticus]
MLGGVVDCVACGAPGGGVECQELFERLLALDHARREPWGSLHGVVVACFLLQHPGHPLAGSGDHGPWWAMLRAYLDGGRDGLGALTQALRRSNSHRRHGRPQWPAVPAVREGAAPTGFGVTIADVAVDGSFPAAGYEDRVRAWAGSTLAAWSADPTG